MSDKMRVMDAVREYGDARRAEETSEDGGYIAALRRSTAAWSVVSGLVILGEDRVVPVASLAPDDCPLASWRCES